MTRIKKIRNEYASPKYETGSDMRIHWPAHEAGTYRICAKPLINGHADVSSVA